MEHLRLFDTEANYNLVKDGFEYPTVSYVEGTDEIKFMDAPLPHDYSGDCLTFVALESGSMCFYLEATGTVSYNKNDTTWEPTRAYDSEYDEWYTVDIDFVSGDKIAFRGDLSLNSIGNGVGTFSTSKRFNVEGNPLSLIYSTNFANANTPEMAFYEMFKNLKIVSAENLILSSNLDDNCYYGMFENCTLLTTPPQLPATTLAQSCYAYMFSGCTSLTTAPALPATTLVTSCYGDMFARCTSLTTAPDLNATNLTWCDFCYEEMFKGCTQINSIKMLAADSSFDLGQFNDWLQGTSATGTIIINPNAQWLNTAYADDIVPSGWTTQNATL